MDSRRAAAAQATSAVPYSRCPRAWPSLTPVAGWNISAFAGALNTWRNERTERNRNIRAAGFELLTGIGSLQQTIFCAHYARGDQRGDPRMGWADMLTINDLAALIPAVVVRDAGELRTVWQADSAGLAEDDEAYQHIDEAIDALRQTTLESLRTLN